MNDNTERKKNIYLSIGLILFALCVTGATYAYFALTASNNSLTGTVGGATLTLTVNKIVPTTQSTNMIPQLESTLGDAISNNYNCVDDHNNVICHVYKATITNSGQATAELKGLISFDYTTNSNYEVEDKIPNLKWKRITNSTTLGEYDTYQALSTDQVFEEGKVFNPNASQEYYFVVWVDETGTEQNDHGVFRVNINFKSKDGDGLTSTVRPPNSNQPNLDNNNLIPVYYDNTNEVWKKADSTNPNNSWYDYDNKMWANAVLIKDDTKRATYQSATKDTPITESDISAFLVWIPRYKYRVWNITRQGGEESTYAYPAYTNGIDIEWESGTSSTGNVECSYNVENSNPSTTLSDVCVYNSTDTITTTSGNSNYTDAWYTHPAFDFGGVPKTGFWIGKFETSGEATAPTILPDKSSLRSQTVSNQFTTSKVFQTYGLSSNIDAHMLTNLEWGAVAYLTHSIYGLCDETGCRGVYHNNSRGYYTGRSGGANSGSTDLNLTNFYGSSVTTSTTQYNTNGYYNYKGYKIDYSGNVTTEKEVSKVASTTGNVTGVYDISGGAYEYVMGNMVDETGAFYPSMSDTSWNGASTLDSKYYNSYSYSSSNYNGQIAWNRARLGDATVEVTGGTSESSAWKPGSGITGSYSGFVSSNSSWFQRGGGYDYSKAVAFYFNRSYGSSNSDYSFRVSLS